MGFHKYFVGSIRQFTPDGQWEARKEHT
jgi:hypothetical protein